MIKNKLIVFITVTALSLANTSFTSMAADDPLSEVNITFTPGDADIGPVDPEDPDTPLDGSNNCGPSGSLVLNYVSTISFGSHKISAFDERIATSTKRPYLQLTDLRGTGEGWDLYACSSTFKNNEVETLKGATITFADAVCATTSNNDSEPPIATKSIILPSDGKTKVKVASANAHTGMGIWIIRWFSDPTDDINDSVILFVPGGSAMRDDNVAQITWYLTSTPA